MVNANILLIGCLLFSFLCTFTGNDETVQEIRAGGGKCHGYVVDVSSREAIYQAAEVVKQEVGKVDILINNAGIVSGKKFVDVSDAQIEKTFQVNALANFWVCLCSLKPILRTLEIFC
jgi:all-trans-retinol dehydrogenase (NAD+)